jgi:hypothetical protein
LLDLFEPALDFPSGAIAFDDLADGKIEIGTEQSDPLGFPIHPNDARGT